MDSKLDESYVMESAPRGRCIIINNVVFQDNVTMPTRIGSTLDAVSLSDLFEEIFTFTVELKRDVTKTELDRLVFDLQNEDYSQDSAFAFIILSYGDEDGSFYCTDGAKISVTDMFESFIASKCPSLANKPKLFFVLMHALVREFVDKSKDVNDDVCCDTYAEATVSPDVEDSLYMLGITSNYSATTLSLKSSYISQVVCAVRGYAYTNDITTVLKKVTDQITKQEDHDKTRLKVISQLQKKLFFFPESSEHTRLSKQSSSDRIVLYSEKGLVSPHSASRHSLPFSEEKLSKLHTPSKCLSMIELGESPHMAVKREMSLNVGSASSQQLQQFRYKFTKSISEPRGTLFNMMSNVDDGSSIPEETNENSDLLITTMKQEISLGDMTISSQSKGNVVSSSLSDLDQEPTIPYHMHSSHRSHGYCIIINNNISDEIMQFEEIQSVLSKEMGFHVEVYTKITRKGIHQLLSSLSSIDHTDLDCLIVTIFSEGKKEQCIYGADDKKLQVKEIIAHFSRDSCKTLSNKPKIFLFETQVKERDLLQASIEDIEMRDAYIQLAIFTEEEIQTTFLHEFVQTVHTIDDCFVFTDIVERTKSILHQSNDTVLFKHVDNLIKPLQFSKCISQNFIQECHQIGQNLIMALQVWLPMRKSTIAVIEKKRDKIIQVCRDSRRSRVAGAVTSIVGGGLAIVGVGLIPVTFGASLIVSGVGAAVGVAGGVTSVGATLANTIISKANLKGAQAIIQVDQQLCEQVNQLEAQLEKAVKSLHKQNPNMSKEEITVALMQGGQVVRLGVIVAKGGVAGVQVARVGGTAAIQGGILAAKVTGAAVRGVSIAGGVVSVLILPLDIYELASNAYRLHKKSESNAVQWFNEQIEQLASQHTEVESLLQGLQNDNRSKITTSQESQELSEDIGTTL